MSNSVSTVAITGSSGGLGSHLVQSYLGKSIIFAIDVKPPNAVLPGVRYITSDLSTEAGQKYASEIILTESKTLDVLINCASSFLPDDCELGYSSTLDHLWKSNTKSTILFTLSLESVLEKGKFPHIVNIASTDGVVASAGQDSEIGVSHDIFYSVTKGAVITFTRALAMKWAKKGIRVNAVCPTIFRSPMTASLLDVPGREDILRNSIPLGRLAEVEDIVECISHIGSMKMTTGHTFPIDGGYLCQ